jgi:hypothetical protein
MTAPEQEGAMDLLKFARWVIEHTLEGFDIDCSEAHDKAVECGILIRTIYAPHAHGDSDYAEPGDEWFVFSPEFLLQEGNR